MEGEIKKNFTNNVLNTVCCEESNDEDAKADGFG